MSISERFRELWQKFRFLGGWQLRMLLLTAMLLGGFLSFYQFRASAEDDNSGTFKIYMLVSSDRCYGCRIPDKPAAGTFTPGEYDAMYSEDLKNSNFPLNVKITRAKEIDANGNLVSGEVIYDDGSIKKGYNVEISWLYNIKGNNCHYWAITVLKENQEYYYFIEFTGDYKGKYFVGDSTNGKYVKVKSTNDNDNGNGNGNGNNFIYKDVCLIKSDYPKFNYQDQYERNLDNLCCYITGDQAPCITDILSEDNKLCMKVRFQKNNDYSKLPKPARINGKYTLPTSDSNDACDYFIVPIGTPDSTYTMTCVSDEDIQEPGDWFNYYYIDMDENLTDPAKSLFINNKFFNARGGRAKVCKDINPDCKHDWVVCDTHDAFENDGLYFCSKTNAINFSEDSVDTSNVKSVEISDDGRKIKITPKSVSESPVIKIKSVDYPKFKTTFTLDDSSLPPNSVEIKANEEALSNLEYTWTFADLDNIKYTISATSGYAIDGSHNIEIIGGNSISSSMDDNKNIVFYINYDQFVSEVTNNGNTEIIFANAEIKVSGVRRQITPTFTSTNSAVKDSVEIQIDDETQGISNISFGQKILQKGASTLDVTLKLKDDAWQKFKTSPPDGCITASGYKIVDNSIKNVSNNITFKLEHAVIDGGTITIDPSIFQNMVYVDSENTEPFTNYVFSTNYTLSAAKLNDSNNTYASTKWSDIKRIIQPDDE